MDELYIKVGIDNQNNRLILTDPGIAILKAVVMKWMEDAERGMATAREMKEHGTGKYPDRQYEYYRNAVSFLSGKLFNIKELHGYDLNKMLRFVKKWPTGQPIPSVWAAFLYHSIEVETDGTDSTPRGGSGSDGNGVPGGDVQGETGGDAGVDHSEGNRSDRKKGRKGTDRGRPKKRKADR